MTSPDVADLLAPQSEEQIEADQLAMLSANGFPTMSWSTVSVPKGLLKAGVRTQAKAFAMVPVIVRGGYAKTAKGGWLTLQGVSQFNEPRRPAVTCQRTLRITDAGGGPYDPIEVGQLVAKAANGLLYRNVTAGAVEASSFDDITFEAESTGSKYNAATSGWELVTPLPGTTIGEPGGVPAIVRQGVDEERDEDYAPRLPQKWFLLGAEKTEDAWLSLAKRASDEVTRVKVLWHTPVPGTATIVIAGPGGAVSPAVVTAVDEYLQARRGLCVALVVQSATNYTIALTGSAHILAAEISGVQAAAEIELDALAANAAIGGKVSRERIIEKLLAEATDDEDNDLTLTTPAADVTLGNTEVPVFDYSGLSWVPV